MTNQEKWMFVIPKLEKTHWAFYNRVLLPSSSYTDYDLMMVGGGPL